MTVGFAVILTVFMSALFFEISLASEIKNVSDYHFDMSLPAISTLDEAIISFERMNLFVHQYYLKSEIISKDDYLFHKNLVLSLIDDYAHLSSSMDRNGEYFADEAMRSNMFRFSSDMGESFKRFDSTSQEIFSLLDSGSNNMPRIELLLNSLDEEVTTFRYIVSNALIMERNGSTIQQNKLVKLETNELNSFIAFSLIELAVISTIFLIFRHSIKSSIYALTSLTTNLSMGNLKKKIEYKNKDEFIPVANNIRIVQKKLLSSHEKLIKSEKLSSIGTLSSRIAHDLKSPLFIIKSNLQLLEMRKGKQLDYRDKEDFSKMDNAVNNMTSIIERVLEHARTRSIEIQEVDSSSLIEGTLNLIIIPKEVTITKPAQNIIFSCDIKQIQVVFSNLITNSIQSMNKKGHISIRLKETKNDLIFEFEDSGPGIPKNALTKIFDPLFTTKPTGTGLGLVSCKNIIAEHKGSISVKNNPTVFTVTLPKEQAQSNVEISPYTFQQ